MKKFLPKSLRGQLLLVILLALVLAQGLSLFLFVDERSNAVRTVLGLEAAGRAANVVRLIDEAPVELYPAILRAANSPLVRFSVDASPIVDHLSHTDGDAVASRINSILGADMTAEIRVELHEQTAVLPPMPGMVGEMTGMHQAMMGGQVTSVEMQISIGLKTGQWLNVSTRFHRPPLQWAWIQATTFLVTALLIAAALWFALNRLTGPLRELAIAADSLGRGDDVAPINPTGPSELVRLTSAFNEMQARLTRFVSERTRLLGALGHDLRSPLTGLRVRAEMVEDDETRDRLIATIIEMQEMVDSTLDFAHGMAVTEPVQNVQLSNFVGTLVNEVSETGGDVTAETKPDLMVRLRPNAMRRALRNVIENAVRYGKRADVRLEKSGSEARITVLDHGTGIPEADIERVFDPFVRLEESRSRDTGGAGLGLSIARTIIHAHGGEISLANQPGGGLAVTVTLPLAEAIEELKP